MLYKTTPVSPTVKHVTKMFGKTEKSLLASTAVSEGSSDPCSMEACSTIFQSTPPSSMPDTLSTLPGTDGPGEHLTSKDSSELCCAICCYHSENNAQANA